MKLADYITNATQKLGANKALFEQRGIDYDLVKGLVRDFLQEARNAEGNPRECARIHAGVNRIFAAVNALIEGNPAQLMQLIRNNE